MACLLVAQVIYAFKQHNTAMEACANSNGHDSRFHVHTMSLVTEDKIGKGKEHTAMQP